jgi:hypothetical protein
MWQFLNVMCDVICDRLSVSDCDWCESVTVTGVTLLNEYLIKGSDLRYNFWVSLSELGQ